MSAAQYLIGLLFFVGTVGGATLAAYVVWRAYFPLLGGVAGLLAWSILFFAALTLTQLLPGALGILTRNWALATALGLIAVAVWVRRWASAQPGGRRARVARLPRPPGGISVTVVVPGLLAAGVTAWALVLLWQRKTTLASPPFSFDMLTFDFPIIARWIQSQSLWVAHDLVALSSHAAYPQNGDLVYLAVILPWRNAFLAPLVTYPVWALTGLGVYALAVELNARPWASILLASVFAGTPLILLSAVVENLPDVYMWATFVCGVLFLVRHLREPQRSELVLAGIALGLAFGSKWYGLTCVPLAVVMWLAASVAAGRGPRLWREAALLVGLILAAGGFWLVRNILEYGDPVFPHQVRAFGVALFSGPVDAYGRAFGFTVAHYLGDWSVWRHYLIPEYKAVLRLGGVLLLAGAAVATAIAGWRARGPSRPPERALRGARLGAGSPAHRGPAGERTALWLGLAALAILLVYSVTPQTAVGPRGMPVLAGINARYAAPGLMLGASIIAWSLSWRRPAFVILAQVVGAASVADAFRTPLKVSLLRLVVAGIVVLAAGCTVAWALRRRPALARAPGRLLVGAAAVVAAVALGAGASGYALQRRFTAHALRGRDPVIDWVITHAPSHSRIGMTGSWSTDVPPVLAMFGPQLDNTVVYVGGVDRGLVEHYTSYGAWISAVRADRLNLLLVGREPQPLESDIEASWVARAGFPVVATSPHFVLYAPHG